MITSLLLICSIFSVGFCVPADLRITSKWRFIEPLSAANYTDIIDLDGETMSIIKIMSKKGYTEQSCYEVVRLGKTMTFCYPQVLIPGHGKCGTSAMYNYLISHDHLFRGTEAKENCPRSSFYGFFETLHILDSSTSTQKISLNGCISPEMTACMHRLLEPNAAYIYMVRDAAQFAWSAYNFWCIPAIETCVPGQWTSKNFERNPEHFHKYLLHLASGGRDSCVWYIDLFTDILKQFVTNSGKTGSMPIVMSIESLESKNRQNQLLRLQKHLNTVLRMNITLDTANFVRVNAGAVLDKRGDTSASTLKVEDGTYEISGFKHMLPITEEFIKICWLECSAVSRLSQYPYDCSKSAF
jgi:hypothetical protein